MKVIAPLPVVLPSCDFVDSIIYCQNHYLFQFLSAKNPSTYYNHLLEQNVRLNAVNHTAWRSICGGSLRLFVSRHFLQHYFSDHHSLLPLISHSQNQAPCSLCWSSSCGNDRLIFVAECTVSTYICCSWYSSKVSAQVILHSGSEVNACAV